MRGEDPLERPVPVKDGLTDIDEFHRFAGRVRKKLREQECIVHVTDEDIGLGFREDRAMGDVLADKDTVRRGDHTAFRVENTNPGEGADFVLQAIDGPLNDIRARHLAHTGKPREHTHLGNAHGHFAIKPVRHLGREHRHRPADLARQLLGRKTDEDRRRRSDCRDQQYRREQDDLQTKCHWCVPA